ncbi:hypothetical protein CTI12_AA099410 [Artemisia annua]|uniref:R13L1/DRL21-like LRR repeat region domain-containing protein n=1 Tax=Artemisia annua TaxID=35608 RepID=A0A2U1PV90_ARTAN|nr:hypothetical protein CTI12_AA099410 [Artemisia annua]
MQNISQKRLTDLEVEWGDVSDCSPMESNKKEVHDLLMSYSDCLEDLRLVSYRYLEFSNWVGDTSFLKVTHVTIYGSKKCASLPPLGQLLSLKELYIQGMEDAKVVGGFGVSWELSCISFVGNSKFYCYAEMGGVDDPTVEVGPRCSVPMPSSAIYRRLS